MAERAKYFFLTFLAILGAAPLFAQDKTLDSLLTRLRTANADTAKVDLLNTICAAYMRSEPLKGFEYASEAARLSGQLNYIRGLSESQYHLGLIAHNQGNYPKALEHHLRASVYAEKTGDPALQAEVLGGIAQVYYNQRDLEQAVAYNMKALEKAKKTGKQGLVANVLNNIANIYSDQENYREALKYHFFALEMRMGNKQGMAVSYNNISRIFVNQLRYDSALYYLTMANRLAIEAGHKNLTARTYSNLGAVYLALKQYNKAVEFASKALEASQKTSHKNLLKDAYLVLSQAYDSLGRYSSALEHYKNYIAVRDSMYNEENTKKTVQAEMNYQFAKQQAADSIKNAETLKQEGLKHEQEIKQQRLYTVGGIIGFMLMLVVAGVSFSAYRQKQKANRVISEQKELVEAKQKEILDSIHYAKRIQQSLLPSEKYVERKLKELKKN
jgi:tetratricopeptide (TPR) repeat protein